MSKRTTTTSHSIITPNRITTSNSSSKRLSTPSSVCSNASSSSTIITTLSARPIYGLDSFIQEPSSYTTTTATYHYNNDRHHDLTEFEDSYFCNRLSRGGGGGVGKGMIGGRSSSSRRVKKSKSSSSAVIPLSRGYNGVGPDSSEDPSIIEKFRRKMLDLEISNTSLMAVNSSLEDTVRVQAQRLNKLKKELTLFKSGMDLNNILTGGDDDKSAVMGGGNEVLFNLSDGGNDSDATQTDVSTHSSSSSSSSLSSGGRSRKKSSSSKTKSIVIPAMTKSGSNSSLSNDTDHSFGRVCSQIQDLIDDAQRALSFKSAVTIRPDSPVENVMVGGDGAISISSSTSIDKSILVEKQEVEKMGNGVSSSLTSSSSSTVSSIVHPNAVRFLESHLDRIQDGGKDVGNQKSDTSLNSLAGGGVDGGSGNDDEGNEMVSIPKSLLNRLVSVLENQAKLATTKPPQQQQQLNQQHQSRYQNRRSSSLRKTPSLATILSDASTSSSASSTDNHSIISGYLDDEAPLHATLSNRNSSSSCHVAKRTSSSNLRGAHGYHHALRVASSRHHARRRIASVPTSLFALPRVQDPDAVGDGEDLRSSLLESALS